jgi:nucleotide-binding universal stress UspA family protein
MKKTNIVVAYDYTVPADLALERGVDIGLRDPERVNLHFVTVIDGGQSYQRADAIHDDLQARLRALFAGRRPGVRGVEVQLFVHVHIGGPTAEILRVAEEVSADLIIVGSHDRGTIGRLLLGSVSQAVLREAHCPVLVARPKTYPPVELQPVVEVTSHPPSRERPHRYSYPSTALLRPHDWPLP